MPSICTSGQCGLRITRFQPFGFLMAAIFDHPSGFAYQLLPADLSRVTEPFITGTWPPRNDRAEEAFAFAFQFLEH